MKCYIVKLWFLLALMLASPFVTNPSLDNDVDFYTEDTTQVYHNFSWVYCWKKWKPAPETYPANVGWASWRDGMFTAHLNYTSGLDDVIYFIMTPEQVPVGWSIIDYPDAAVRGVYRLDHLENALLLWKCLVETWWTVPSTYQGVTKPRPLVIGYVWAAGLTPETSVRATQDQLSIFIYEPEYYLYHDSWRSFHRSCKESLELAQAQLEKIGAAFNVTEVTFGYEPWGFHLDWGLEVPQASSADVTATLDSLYVDFDSVESTEIKPPVELYVLIVIPSLVLIVLILKGKKT